MGMKFFGRYVGPIFDASSDDDGNQENNQQNTEITDYEGAYKKLLADSKKKEADHAKSYSSLQTTLTKKDDELKTTRTALEERNATYNELNTTHSTLATDAEKVTKDLKEKSDTASKLLLEVTRKRMFLRPEFIHLAQFENEGLIPDVNALKEDGTVDEPAIENILKKFSSSITALSSSTHKKFKTGEIPDEPTPEAPSTSSVLKAKAFAFQKEHKTKEYNDTMNQYYAALKEESK